MPITEIVEIAAARWERTIDFRYLPGVIRNKAMPAVERVRPGPAQIRNDAVLIRAPPKKDPAVLSSRACLHIDCITCEESQTITERLRSISDEPGTGSLPRPRAVLPVTPRRRLRHWRHAADRISA